MMEEGEVSPYQKHEAATLHHTLQRLEEKYFDFLAEKFPDFTFEVTRFQSPNGGMYLPLDIFRRTGGAPANKSQIDKLVNQYRELED
jgi:hypothetical protein